jgi:hypothetical protein
MGGGGGGKSTTTQGIDPVLQPFVKYGLGESRRLYQSDTPQFFPGQTFVGPSEATTSAIQAATNRALQGSPLTGAAQQQQLGTIGGQYLGANPFLEAALRPGAQASTQQFYDAMRGLGSQASAAGRYGSGAMGQQEGRAEMALANALTNQAGKLAFENYAAERGRQEAAAAAAPQMAMADYADINQLLKAGTLGESYQQKALEDEMSRFEFEQNKPYAKLSTFLSSVYYSTDFWRQDCLYCYVQGLWLRFVPSKDLARTFQEYASSIPSRLSRHLPACCRVCLQRRTDSW